MGCLVVVRTELKVQARSHMRRLADKPAILGGAEEIVFAVKEQGRVRVGSLKAPGREFMEDVLRSKCHLVGRAVEAGIPHRIEGYATVRIASI